MSPMEQDLPKLIISFRGTKYDDFEWTMKSSLSDVTTYLSACVGDEEGMSVKLIHKGKVLLAGDDDSVNLHTILSNLSKQQINGTSKKPIRLMAMGATVQETKQNDDAFRRAKSNAPRIKDDLSSAGKVEIAARQRLGRKMLQKAGDSSSRSSGHSTEKKYGFHRIETLPMLPEQQKAQEILKTLASDPGVLACMAKHQWNVGCLAELYPEGKVGESDVCVMGLNQNKGQKILLRLRTETISKDFERC